MANLKNVIYISNEDYNTLVTTGTVTINGETLTYDPDNVYITPDVMASSSENGLMSASDKTKLDGIASGATANAGTVTSVRVQATSPVQSSTSTAQSSSLNTTISLADGYGDTKNPYGVKNPNKVLAGPSSGSTDAAPTFRALVKADLPSLTASDVGALPNNTTYVSSVNGNSGAITDVATQTWVGEQGYTNNTGTVTSVQVQAGTGLSSSTNTAQTSSLNTTISIANGYKLPTTTEWGNKADSSAVPSVSINTTSGSESVTINGSSLNFGANAFNSTAIPTTYVSTVNGSSGAITGIATTSDLSGKLDKKPDGTNDLISNNKISSTYIPDVLLGQLVYGGSVTGAGVATLSTNAQTKLGTSSSSITLTNNTTAITGYGANEGIFYVVSSTGTFASLDLKTGDWLISTGSAWTKIDNTDEVTSVQIQGDGGVISSSTSTVQTGLVSTTISHSEALGTAQSTAKVWKQTLDKYGHVTGATEATASDVGALPSTTSLVNNATTAESLPSACTANGFYNVRSTTNSVSGADSNPFLQYHSSSTDFRILTTAYSNKYLQQIATDYYSNHVFYRYNNNGTWSDWKEIVKESDLPTVDQTYNASSTNAQSGTAVAGALSGLESKLGSQIIELEDNGSTTAGTWLAKTSKISALVAGQVFLYQIAVAGASTTKLNITGSAGTALGAKNIYRYGTTKLTTQYPVGAYLLLYYNGTYFFVFNDYDTDTNTKVREYQAGTAERTGTQYPILTRYAVTDKAGSYDANYSRYHTDTYIDTSTGNIYAPNLAESSISTGSTSTNMPTSAAVASFVEGKGYTTNTGTITGVSVNGTSVATSGVAALTNIAKTNADNNFSSGQTISGKVTVKNGSASGGLTLGGDVNATTVTANARKLARMTAPTYESNGSAVVGFVSIDNNALNTSSTNTNNGNGVEFGSRTGDSTSYGPDYISFSVASSHNNVTRKNIAQFVPNKVQFFNHESGSSSIETTPRYNGLIGMWELNNNNTFVNNGYTYTLPNTTGTLALSDDIPTSVEGLSGGEIDGSVVVTDYDASCPFLINYNWGNADGFIGIYDENEDATTYIITNQSPDDTEIYITLPKASGTLATTSDIPTISISATEPILNVNTAKAITLNGTTWKLGESSSSSGVTIHPLKTSSVTQVEPLHTYLLVPISSTSGTIGNSSSSLTTFYGTAIIRTPIVLSNGDVSCTLIYRSSATGGITSTTRTGIGYASASKVGFYGNCIMLDCGTGGGLL